MPTDTILYELGLISVSILQIKKLGHTDVQLFAQCDTAGR